MNLVIDGRVPGRVRSQTAARKELGRAAPFCLTWPLTGRPPRSLFSTIAYRMIARACLTLFAVAGFALTAPAQVANGDSRESVLTMYGRPVSTAKRGNREIFLYPKGGRIEFVDGKVADVKGPLPEVAAAVAPAETAAASAEPSPTTATSAARAPGADAAATAAPPKAPDANAASEPNADAFNPAVAANELAKHVDALDTARGGSPVEPDVPEPLDSLALFLAGLLLRFGITVVALKLAFKYWEMDAFWKGTFAIAGIDLAVHATLELLGPVTGGLTTMGAVENGIPALVLVLTIHRFCFNKRIENALATAVAVKTIVTICYIFVAVALLNLLFG